MGKIPKYIQILAATLGSILTVCGIYYNTRTEQITLKKVTAETNIVEMQEEEYGCRYKHRPLDEEVKLLKSKIKSIKNSNNEQKSAVFTCEVALSECRDHSSYCQESLERIRQGECNDMIPQQQQVLDAYVYQPGHLIKDDLPGFECVKTIQLKSEFIAGLKKDYKELLNIQTTYRFKDCMQLRKDCIKELDSCYSVYEYACPDAYSREKRIDGFLSENREILNYY